MNLCKKEGQATSTNKGDQVHKIIDDVLKKVEKYHTPRSSTSPSQKPPLP